MGITFMKINIFLFITKVGLPPDLGKLLKKVILEHAKKAAKFLDIKFVNIVVYPNQKLSIPETGEGGYTPCEDWFRISIDPSRSRRGLVKIIKKIIPSTVYHEMNHAARWQSQGYGVSLPEAIISEGLAIVFAEEQWKEFEVPWGKYTKNEIKRLLKMVKERKSDNDKPYNHAEWFFGKGKPRWLGYKVGAFIIRSLRKKRPEIEISELTKFDFKKIIDLSGLEL
jgi:uncharacterized protein YjaZ